MDDEARKIYVIEKTQSGFIKIGTGSIPFLLMLLGSFSNSDGMGMIGGYLAIFLGIPCILLLISGFKDLGASYLMDPRKIAIVANDKKVNNFSGPANNIEIDQNITQKTSSIVYSIGKIFCLMGLMLTGPSLFLLYGLSNKGATFTGLLSVFVLINYLFLHKQNYFMYSLIFIQMIGTTYLLFRYLG